MQIPRTKQLVPAVGTALVGLSIAFIAYQIWAMKLWQVQSIDSSQLVLTLLISATAYSGLGVLLSLGWWRLLIYSVPNKITRVQAFYFYGKTQIHKYLPGNVFHYVSRQLHAGRLSIGQSEMVLVSVKEVFTMFISAFLIGFPALYIYLKATYVAHLTVVKPLYWTLLVVLVGVVLLIGTVYFRKSRFCKFGFLSGGVGVLMQAVVIYSLFFLCSGLIFSLLLVSIGDTRSAIVLPLDFFYVMSAVTLAWIAGFVLPGAAAGIGVRELVLLSLISDKVDGETAMIATLLYRGTTLLGDIFYYGLATALVWLKPSTWEG